MCPDHWGSATANAAAKAEVGEAGMNRGLSAQSGHRRLPDRLMSDRRLSGQPQLNKTAMLKSARP